MNRLNKAAVWTVLGGLMLAMTWKGNQEYREYRALSDGLNALAAAYQTSGETPGANFAVGIY